MHSSAQPSTPTRSSYNNSKTRDYGSSGFVTGGRSHSYSYSQSPYSSPSVRTTNETSFNDTDFSDFNLDAVSQASNDILATIDGDLICFEANNVSTLYNNAADAFSNNTAFNCTGGAAKQPTHKPLTRKRLIFILAPLFGIEFARTFTCLYMLVNLNAFFRFNIHDLSLPISGVLGTFVVQCIAMKLRTLQSTMAINLHDKRNVLVKMFLSYQIVIVISLALIAGTSWAILSSDNTPNIANLNSTLINVVSPDGVNKNTTDAKAPPIIFPIFLMIGYILVTSATGSGQYFLLSFITHFDPNVSSQSASSFIVLWSALGGAVAGLIGILDTASNWCPRHDCYDHVTAQAAILSPISLCLCLICIAISTSTIYLDPILELWERIVLYRKTHFFIDPNFKESQSPQEQKKERTAQEDFDECAALLEASGRSFSSSHFTGHSVGSQNTLLDTEDGASNATTATTNTNIKLYAHQIPKPIPTLKRMLRRKAFVSAVVLISFLSCLSVVFQYYTPRYLGSAVFDDHESEANHNLTTKTAHSEGDGAREMHLNTSPVESYEKDKNRSAGLKLSCAGAFLYNLIFMVIYLKRKWVSNTMNSRYKPWTCPLLFLVMSAFTITLMATDSGAMYLITAFIYGMVRIVETEMLHTIARKVDTSWPPVDEAITSTPQSFLWSLVPMSTVVPTLLLSSLTLWSEDPHVSMAFVAVFSLILVVGFGISRVKII